MKQKACLFILAFIIVLFVGWVFKHDRGSEVTAEEPFQLEQKNTVPFQNENKTDMLNAETQKSWPAPAPNIITQEEKRQISPQHYSDNHHIATADEQSVDLSQHRMSIKKEESKGYEVLPGVNVKSGVVHIQIDSENNQSVEIEKNPANSTSDYQLLVKKKF